ncbi:hypothetical protein C4571_03715 [Candidatus Parcubacteria bacterium]|nr:MAG: hypothetical protein C4571_03715 [Candidatus Parcubacteria bacterium]
MKKRWFAFFISLAISFLAYTEASVQTGDIIQINNLVVESVSGGTIPGEIIASRERPDAKAKTTCVRFESLESKVAIPGLCPNPPVTSSAFPNFRIAVQNDTKLILRDRQAGSLSNFGKGDRINVFGVYTEEGTLRATVLRNITKPIPQDFIQLLNLEVAGISNDGQKTIFAIQRPDAACQGFARGWKEDIPCPIGISTDSQSKFLDGRLPDAVKTQLHFVRKYEIVVTPTTSVLDRSRTPMKSDDIGVGDSINVYGAITQKDAPQVEAEILRDLSKPRNASEIQQFEGIITRINQGDGSFLVRTRDGKQITVPTSFQVDSFIKIRGILDELGDKLSEVTEIVLQKKSDVDPIPAITRITPGTGPIGTEIVLMGSGFTPQGNSINFGTAQRLISNLSSADGKTLLFIIPATLCISGTVCPDVVLSQGNYDVSVSNKNGLSNAISFSVAPLPPLGFTTPSLPQAIENSRYSTTIEARGGAGTYKWQITQGSLPPGLQIIPGTCANEPCRAPLTIKGTPTIPGNYSFTLTLTSRNETVSQAFTLVVVYAVSTGY